MAARAFGLTTVKSQFSRAEDISTAIDALAGYCELAAAVSRRAEAAGSSENTQASA
jgi:hypothetical protein